MIDVCIIQPQLEGLFACLDIWGVFLDYLIGKVANARSDKLAEAEATVSRYREFPQVIGCIHVHKGVHRVKA